MGRRKRRRSVSYNCVRDESEPINETLLPSLPSSVNFQFTPCQIVGPKTSGEKEFLWWREERKKFYGEESTFTSIDSGMFFSREQTAVWRLFLSLTLLRFGWYFNGIRFFFLGPLTEKQVSIPRYFFSFCKINLKVKKVNLVPRTEKNEWNNFCCGNDFKWGCFYDVLRFMDSILEKMHPFLIKCMSDLDFCDLQENTWKA